MDCSPPDPVSMGFSGQAYWSSLLFPSPGDLPDPGFETTSPGSPALTGRFLTAESPSTSLVKCISDLLVETTAPQVLSTYIIILNISCFLGALNEYIHLVKKNKNNLDAQKTAPIHKRAIFFSRKEQTVRVCMCLAVGRGAVQRWKSVFIIALTLFVLCKYLHFFGSVCSQLKFFYRFWLLSVSPNFIFFSGIIWASQVVLMVKNPPANAGRVKDMGLRPGLGRSPGEGNGNSLQHSCL